MTIELNHTIVPSHYKEASAKFFARIFGLQYEGLAGHFAPVRVNDSLTLDFDDDEGFRSSSLKETPMVRFYILLAFALTAPQAVHAADYHHVHLTADPAEAGARWYVEHMDCEDFGRANACRIGSVELIFFDRDPAGGSVGTGADHIGISFADLTAKMAELETAGVTVLEPLRQGRWPLAFIEDPWGTKVEVVEDPDVVGFHHVHLLSADPEATMTWYEDVFGGERQPDARRRLRFGQVSLRFRQAEDSWRKPRGAPSTTWAFSFPTWRPRP